MSNLLNFKSFFNFLNKSKAYTAIEVFGLSVSLMFVILIAVFSIQSLSTDRFHKKGDRIYTFASEESIGSAWRIAERIAERYPEIEEMCPVVDYTYGTPVSIGEDRQLAELLFSNDAFFNMFSFPLIQGDSKTVLAAKNYAVISESFARKAFSDRDPMGQIIAINDSVHVMVNGIMKDIGHSTISYCDILVRIDNVRFFNSSLDSQEGSNAIGCQVYFLEQEGAELQAKAKDISEYLKEFFWIYKRGIYQKVNLIPLKDIYFSDLPTYAGYNRGNWKFIIILMSVGLLILIFAVINYINLTVAQTGSRAKEMATRRLLGSSRKELFRRLIMESTMLVFISFLLAMFLSFAVVSFAGDLLGQQIDLMAYVTPVSILIAVSLIFALGLISGLLPATVISNSKPIDIVKGSFRTKTKMIFSKFFITFQNVITIMLLVASITMFTQVKYMVEAPLGYNTTNIIQIPTYQLGGREKIDLFVNEARQLASVDRIAYAQGYPFDGGNNNTVEYEGKNISFQWLVGDSAYLNMLGFEKIRENNVSGIQYYLNEQAMQETGLPEDAPYLTFWGHQYPIAGIVRDFQLKNILHDKSPLILQIQKSEDLYPWDILVEVSGDPFQARNQIKEVYERISKLEFSGAFIEQQIEDSFQEQQRIAKIIVIFSFIAVLLSLLGLLAMSTYFIRQNSRTMAVRKVFGSSNRLILFRLVGTFLLYVIIAFIIATPVSWYIMEKWLANYSYRISLYPWIFMAAGLFCLFISFITVYWQSYKAANTNPVISIKAE